MFLNVWKHSGVRYADWKVSDRGSLSTNEAAVVLINENCDNRDRVVRCNTLSRSTYTRNTISKQKQAV